MGTSCILMQLKCTTKQITKRFFQGAAALFVRSLPRSRSSARKDALCRQLTSYSKLFCSSLKFLECQTVYKTSAFNLHKYSGLLCESSDDKTEATVSRDFKLHENFVSEEEKKFILDDVEDYLEDMEYEYDHWDNAIHGYKETEKSRWSDQSQAILQRVRVTAFPAGENQLSLVHVLDLAKDGYIKPHVDSVKFCGSTITGLSLLSSAVMRLAREDDPKQWVNILLRPRSLYVIRGKVRYEFTHEILKDDESLFRGQRIPRERRISVMCRNEPS